MNNLSWFLYFADVLPSLSSLSGVAGLVFTAFFIVYVIFVVSSETWPCNSVEENQRVLDREKNLPSKFKWLSVPLFLFVLAVLIPSKETIYLIAGSEAGEAVVTSEEGQEILSDIREVVSYQLDRLKEDQ